MKLWPLFLISLLAPQSALRGQDVAGLEQKGNSALASGLWEVAELRFREYLDHPGLSVEEKTAITVRLAEALVRAGKGAEALECLNLSWVGKHPDADFWRAQALAKTGKFLEAVEIFGRIAADPGSTHRAEAGFSQANLQLALDQPEIALETLAALATGTDPQTATKYKLLSVEILLDMDRPEEAGKMMPASSEISPKDQPLAAFLEAHLALAKKDYITAVPAFQALVSQPQGQSLTRYHAAVIGRADALHAQGYSETAAMSLLTFISDPDREYLDFPALDAMFKRLELWLPDSPTATDPILEQVTEWIKPPEIQALGFIGDPPDANSAAAGAWVQTINKPNELLAYSMFTRAIGLHRIGTPEAKDEARRLLTRVRLENPDHPLANRALYLTARWLLDEGHGEQAFSVLATLRENGNSPAVRGEAAFMEAQAAYSNGDSKLAIQLFDEAARELPKISAKAARLNSGIARLRMGDLNGVTLIQQENHGDTELEANLELERALVEPSASGKVTAIQQFLADHPSHSRVPEARLALVETSLANSPPDLALATAQLQLLEDAPASLEPSRLALARLRTADLSHDSTATIQLARSIMDSFPADPAAAEAAFTLGRNLFETNEYNPALLALKKLAATDTDHGRAQAAWLLAARSAALVGTPASKEEAITLFDNAIALEGPLASVARLEKGDHLIKKLYRFAEASGFLKQWFDSLPANDELRLPAGLLLGQALNAEGSTNPTSLLEALDIYNQLLPHAAKHPALIHRLQYLRGLVLEQLPDEKDPTKKRESQAFIAYYSVLETTTPPVEWEFFESCGFKALTLLEKAGRWPAAVATAEKIASFKGPRAEEAATHASQIQLKHMMWED